MKYRFVKTFEKTFPFFVGEVVYVEKRFYAGTALAIVPSNRFEEDRFDQICESRCRQIQKVFGE